MHKISFQHLVAAILILAPTTAHAQVIISLSGGNAVTEDQPSVEVNHQVLHYDTQQLQPAQNAVNSPTITTNQASVTSARLDQQVAQTQFNSSNQVVVPAAQPPLSQRQTISQSARAVLKTDYQNLRIDQIVGNKSGIVTDRQNIIADRRAFQSIPQQVRTSSNSFLDGIRNAGGGHHFHH